MELIIWPRLNHRSKVAMRRRKKSWGWTYSYTPREVLVNRLSRELNMTPEQVREQIRREREYIRKYHQYY